MSYIIKIYYADSTIDSIEIDGFNLQAMARPAFNPVTQVSGFEFLIKRNVELSPVDLLLKVKNDISVQKFEYIKNDVVLKTFENFGPAVYSFQSQELGVEGNIVPIETLTFYKV